jgi:hypothetical protein
LVQGLVFLGEVEADVAVDRLAEEAGAGDADALGDFLGGDGVVGEAERGEV